MHNEQDSSRGFTLIELVMALAIAAILAMIGAPALGNLLARTRVSGAEAKIADTLRHARNAAVMHNSRVVVCPSDDGSHCLSGYDWQHGWIVGPDRNGNGEIDGIPFAVVTAMSPRTGIITSTGRRHVTFHPDGNAAGTNATFTICHAQQQQGRSVVISNTGRVRIADPEPARLQECLAGIQ